MVLHGILLFCMVFYCIVLFYCQNSNTISFSFHSHSQRQKTKILISSSVLSHNQSFYHLLKFTCCIQHFQDLTLSMCHFSSTFLHRVLSNVFANCLPHKTNSHIGCICLTFLHCAFSNVSSKCLPQKRHSHIRCICLTFLHCAFSNVSSSLLP